MTKAYDAAVMIEIMTASSIRRTVTRPIRRARLRTFGLHIDPPEGIRLASRTLRMVALGVTGGLMVFECCRHAPTADLKSSKACCAATNEKAVCFKLSDITSSTRMRRYRKKLQQMTAAVYQTFPCHPAHVVSPTSARRPKDTGSIPGRNVWIFTS